MLTTYQRPTAAQASKLGLIPPLVESAKRYADTYKDTKIERAAAALETRLKDGTRYEADCYRRAAALVSVLTTACWLTAEPFAVAFR